MAWRFVQVEVERDAAGRAALVRWTYRPERLRAALARDGAYLLLSDRADWTPEQLWTTYMQLTQAEDAFRAMKSHLLLRPMWHQHAGRIQAHVFVCVLAYALWKALDHLLRQAGAMTRLRKRDEECKQASPQDRPMSPAAALQLLHDVQIGDILLTQLSHSEQTEGRGDSARAGFRQRSALHDAEAAGRITAPERIRGGGCGGNDRCSLSRISCWSASGSM